MKYTCSNTKLSPLQVLQGMEKHPCYSPEAQHRYARMHLPVAPGCNISCNYCNRKYDCANESRPGVTSEVLTPLLAQQKFIVVKEKMPNLSVVGIAGPGDALANWPNTREAIERIKESNPEMIFCLSTNGLLLTEYAAEIIELGIKHVTVTANCLDLQVGAKIYRHIFYRGQKYEGVAGAKILIEKQLAGIQLLASLGVLVKVNIVMISGVNDHQIPALVKKVKELGAIMTNIMPLIPAKGSAFAHLPATNLQELEQMRDLCQIDLQQMRHCRQCRADAIGMLNDIQ